MGFSKKRFFWTLGLSVVVWIGSAFLQAIFTSGKYIATFTQGCQATGYPIDICLLPATGISSLVVSLINIFIWFWIIHFFWGFLDKKLK